ncbi:MAG: DUF1800 family protein [Bacteroidota bacterium]|nr:DUF1800 family protein [Bacteroidota bacterium]
MKRRQFLTDVMTDKELPKAIPVEKFQNQKIPDHLELGVGSIAPYSGVWNETKLKHLLRRTLFGYSKSDLDFFKTKSMDEAVDILMDIPTSSPTPPINAYNTPRLIDPNINAGETWVNGPDDPTFIVERRQSLYAWNMQQLLKNDRHIQEKMTIFLHNHFATESEEIFSPIVAYRHHKLLRDNCLGNFKDMIKKITIDTGMLYYLNGYVNSKTAPDENYARELMELFTLGKSPESQYTEDDVKAAARTLTGWSINPTDFQTFFSPFKHDTTNKTFSSFYNNTVITGKTGTNGELETDDLINMIFTKEDIIARFIVRKLYRYFVYYVIDTNIENNVIVPLANIFKQNWELKPVVTALLKSEHFYDNNNIGCMIKNPLDAVGNFIKAFNIPMPTDTIQKDYASHLTLWSAASSMGMNFGNPPNVSGWSAYYQTPQYYQLWLNSDTLPKRIMYSVAAMAVGIDYPGGKLQADLLEFAKQFPNPENPNLLLQNCIDFFYAMDISSTKKAELKNSTLLFGLNEDFYWTNAWNDYINDPTDASKKNTANTGIALMLKYLLDLAENQLI